MDNPITGQEKLHWLVIDYLERIVTDIDTIVRSVRCSGWQTSQPGDREVRKQLRLVKKYGLPMTGPLFDRACAYVAQHY